MSNHTNGVADPSDEVEVDQQALVKILSRYPGTFDVLRELIQNADDAEAHSIEIHFQSEEVEESRPPCERDARKVMIRKWVIKNDGPGFQERDWERLGKIAYGNDNSAKVGAFGVGFYGVLSKSDEPLVKSNGKSLQFRRGKDGKLRKQSAGCPLDSQTSVELELRELEPLPVLVDLTRFLVSSVAFLTHINTFSVHLDSDRVLHVQKAVEPAINVPIAPHLKPTTLLGAVTVKSIQRTVQSIAVDATGWAFTSSSTSSSPVVGAADTLAEQRSEADHPTSTLQTADAMVKDNTIRHDLYIATTSVNPSPEMKKGVESSMKPLPPSFKCKVVYFNSEQYDSLANIKSSNSPKAKLLARLLFGPQSIVPENDSGRLFIGQSTNQTTGVGLHISAHFLPTMERGAIDLANGQVAAWNKEVLRMSGFLARVIYEEEMNAAKSKGVLATQLGLRTMGRFAFGPTIPHSGVSKILQDAFFSCCNGPKSPFPVVSDAGISCASDARFRQCNKDLTFLKTYLVLHDDVEARQRSEIITRYSIPLFKFDDIVQEFQSVATQDAMKSFFLWWDDLHRNPRSSTKETRDTFCKKFAHRGVVRSSQGVEMALKSIKYFTFFPLPDGLTHPKNIYVDVTQHVPTRNAVECFGWTQLSLLDWLKHVCSQVPQPASGEDSGPDSDVGYRILRVLVQFALVETLSAQQWNQVADLMKDLECIPTNMGRQLPANSYFDEAAVSRNLPIAEEGDFLTITSILAAVEGGFESRFVDLGHVRKVLSGIRVRKEMDWDDMVRILEGDSSAESNFRLVLYLLQRIKSINPQQLDGLKGKQVFQSEKHGRASATGLLLPNEDVRKLGLPILALPRDGIASLQSAVDQFSSSPVEPWLIESLGIQRYPTLRTIITLAASDNPEVRSSALRHLLSNLETSYKDYKPADFAEDRFIPTKCGSYARLNEVFESPIWKNLGFEQPPEGFYRDLSRLGVKEDPSVDTIIQALNTPERRPSDINSATILFEHLYLHGDIPIPMLREQLSTIAFVPVETHGPSSSGSSLIRHFSPKECFIVSGGAEKHYRDIFPFVDFGQNGNSFLESCCAKKSPDASDIVRKILENPQGYLDALQNDTNLYLEDLRTIASRLDSIPPDDKRKMQKAAMFLPFSECMGCDKLLPAERILISDWESFDFGNNVCVAPKDDVLEKMYREMGSVFLGTYVRHDIIPIPHKAEYNLPFDRDQVILRIKCFMKERDDSPKTDVSLQDLTDNLCVKACKCLTLKKVFAPPFGILADSEPVEPVETRPLAGFKLDEADESYTLWIVKRSSALADLHKHIAVALCHVLLKTYRTSDVLLLASLFAIDDRTLEVYYSETKPKSPSAVGKQAKSKKTAKNKGGIQLPLHRIAAHWKAWGILSKQATSAEQDMVNAMKSWGESNSNDKTPDFSGPCQPHPPSPKKQNHKCKQVPAILLVEKEDLQDETTKIKFFMTRGSMRWGSLAGDLDEKIEEFAEIIYRLAKVFGREASESCYIFWKDTDEDLMAFNREKYIYLNLAHYRSCGDKDKKKVITDWYLIMAHEIAHNVTMDHDEYHGSLSTRLAVTHFSDLHGFFPEISWGE